MLVAGGIDVIEMDSEEDEDENIRWANPIRNAIRGAAESRGWSEKAIKKLLNDGSGDFINARLEMTPART